LIHIKRPSLVYNPDPASLPSFSNSPGSCGCGVFYFLHLRLIKSSSKFYLAQNALLSQQLAMYVPCIIYTYSPLPMSTIYTIYTPDDGETSGRCG